MLNCEGRLVVSYEYNELSFPFMSPGKPTGIKFLDDISRTIEQ